MVEVGTLTVEDYIQTGRGFGCWGTENSQTNIIVSVVVIFIKLKKNVCLGIQLAIHYYTGFRYIQ